ncbi:MAG TPA: GYD domain-containing protein [Thermoplasmata archaeon]|nr:GYD domain-containing protein [Thermoplasmata archaeon]
MAVYVVLSRLTDEGRKTIKAKPERLKEVNEEISKMGAKVLHQFALLGEYDFLNILEAEDNATISKIMVDLGSRGTLETNTLSAIPINDFLAGLKP